MIIDCSRHQGFIDWPRVRAAGVTTAIMRCTLGAATDSQFAFNWKDSRNAGIPNRGVYHYVITEVSASAQINKLLAVTGGDFGTEPITLDCERREDERLSLFSFPRPTYTRLVKDILAGLTPYAANGLRIYTSKIEWEAMTTMPPWAKDYLHWLAQYNDHVSEPDRPASWDWQLWQYSRTGRVDGIATNVDLSRANVAADPDAALRAGIGAQAAEIVRLTTT